MQERTTPIQLRLRDLGYRKALVMGFGSCFTPLKTSPSHHKPHNKLWFSGALAQEKQIRRIVETINITWEP